MRFKTLLLVVSSVAAFAASGCAKKGSGTGKREIRPYFEDSGTIRDDGNDNQKPKPDDPKVQKPDPTKPKPAEPVVMNPEAKQILADCFKIDVKEVADVVGWTDATASKDAATALCAKLAAVKYDGKGGDLTALPVTVE